jgi:hypothetical protein
MDRLEWIIIEVVAVLVENFMFLFFLNNRFESKFESIRPLFVTWCILVSWGLSATFLGLPLYDFITCVILLIYLIIAKNGSIVQKIIGTIISYTIMLGTSFIGAGLASLLTSTSINHTLIYQDTSRLLAIIFIKMIQIVLFYILAKKQKAFLQLKRRPIAVLSVIVIVDFISLVVIRKYIETPNLTIEQNNLLIALAIGALLIMIGIFFIFELFIREEMTNVDLAVKLQRLELESKFLNEIDVMYSDMRAWRHDYNNNLTALRAIVEHGEKEDVLHFIDNIASESSRNNVTLQTGNLALDAIVSSKLWLAHSLHIDVTIQAVYPENNRISDTDLCAIAGNLLDNAIEACECMMDIGVKKFINFVLLVKSKNLFISISNSYSHEIKREGEHYLTTKKTHLHGIGISHVDSIVKKYDGHVLRSYNSGIFDTQVMLPLIAPVGGK